MKNSQPTVGDLYCGAGGFSEGFRQAGFKVVWGVDNWEPAATTFRYNFPETRLTTENLLSLDSRRLEPVDVLIGSPPCTQFSLANKGGNGDVKTGLELVKRFMQAVDVLRPHYWIMENVAHLDVVFARTLAKRILNKYFPERHVVNSVEFTVPQTRRRLFSGKYPTTLTPLQRAAAYA